MLRRAHKLIGAKIHAIDGDMGHVDDFYFYDDDWTVRYVIARTGPWFLGRQVMLSPSAIREWMWDAETLHVDLTKDQIKGSPDLDLAKPVTREQEMELARYYQWPTYGSLTPAIPDVSITNAGVVNTAVPSTAPAYAESTKTATELTRAAQASDLPHVHGIRALTGYRIVETDGEIGHVDDFFIDENSWQIQYLLIDTGTWLPGRKVLISTKWVEDIVWSDSQVLVNVTREQVKNSPEYDPRETVERPYEERLHDHYGFPPYWA